jgi:predicted RNA binding protein YcfA (HicA-like mRNA interferase family)
VGESVLVRVLRGTSDAGIRFHDLCTLLRRLGFTERVKGSHHIFIRDGIDEILNVQPKGTMAKPYQVKQVRRVLVQYRLAEEGQ